MTKPSLLRRDWAIWDDTRATDTPSQPALCGHSLKWMCTECGKCYAVMQAYKDEALQPFTFLHGCCAGCKGNRYHVPGSLEALKLYHWANVPLEILRYQLSIEIDFLAHPNHPHNRSES